MSTKRQAVRTLTQYLAVSITGRNGHFNLLGLFFVFPRTVFFITEGTSQKTTAAFIVHSSSGH